MKKILITGAYGNGNIGDEYQASSVASHIHAAGFRSEVYAKSLLDDDHNFFFPNNQRIRTARLENEIAFATDAHQINEFDALIIGGGGLLAADHKPLFFSDWVEKIQIPIMLLSVGADHSSVKKAERLLEKSKFVTARDDYSLSVIQKFRPEVTFVPDPILTNTKIIPMPRVPSDAVCFVPRRVVSKNIDSYQHFSNIMRKQDFVVSMFPLVDIYSGVEVIFGKNRVFRANTLKVLSRYFCESAYVISERYHGCIIALKLGIPCLGVITASQKESSKIYNLYKQLGIEDLLIFPRRENYDLSILRDRIESFSYMRYKTKISSFVPIIRAQINAFLQNIV